MPVTHNVKMNHNINGTDFSLNVDRLSVTLDEPNPTHVDATVSQLIAQAGERGCWVTKSAGYAASCKFAVPAADNPAKSAAILFQAKPYKPGAPAYRVDFNPSKIGLEGQDLLLTFLDLSTNMGAEHFFSFGSVTRLDVALDLRGHSVGNVIVRAKKMRKHGCYSNQHGEPETIRIGTPRGKSIVAYDWSYPGEAGKALRLECRLKPKIMGAHLPSLQNPFAGIQLIPTSALPDIGIPTDFIADTLRVGGLKRALPLLPKHHRKTLSEAVLNGPSLLPDVDAIWAFWPDALTASGIKLHPPNWQYDALPLAA